MITQKAKHTPGPWRISSFRRWYVIPGDEAEPVCSLAEFTYDGLIEHVFPDDDEDAAKANAHLIAAAPELLEALEAYVDACKKQHIKLGPITGNAIAVIRKAKGEL